MLEVERREGRPLEDVLTDMINETGSVEAAGERLGVPTSTTRWWCWRLGIGLHVQTRATRRPSAAVIHPGGASDRAAG